VTNHANQKDTMSAERPDRKNVPRHVSRGIVGTIFTLAIAAATGREFVHDAPTTTIVGGTLMAVGTALRAASDFSDPQLKKGVVFRIGAALFFVGLLFLALNFRR
jgi:hypothetical protein